MKIRFSRLLKVTLLPTDEIKGYAALYREHIEGIE